MRSDHTPQQSLCRGAVERPGAKSLPPRLLIVDDDCRAARVFRRILSQTDRNCRVLHSPDDVVDTLRNYPSVDVIVTDLCMPHRSGIDLIREVREQFADRGWMQFILVTGQASLESAVSAMRLEAVDYLLKPVTPRELVASVRNAMVRTQKAREALNASSGPRVEQLASLANAARSIAAELARICQGTAEPEQPVAPLGPQPNPMPSAVGSLSPAKEYETLRFLTGMQEVRSGLFGDAVSPDPAWEMLAELMLNTFTGRRIPVTSLCLASKAPITTALRRIDDLIRAGLVVRTRDPSDRRRLYVELSEEGKRKMKHYLNVLASSIGGPLEMPKNTNLQQQ